ncbi:MAG: oxidase, partial [Sulfolobales archaeon]|nr:oxidase [Sulfolobales archaeon]
VKGRVITAQGLGLPQLVGNIGLALSWEAAFPAVTNVGRSARISKAMSGLGALAILGGILVFVSAAFLLIGESIDYMLGASVEWVWITLLTIGILLVAIPGLKAAKSI